jgi:hypothetical protein
MNLPPRVVIVLSFVQAFFVVSGYFLTRSSLKFWDHVAPGIFGTRTPPPIPAISQFIRSYGLLVLLVPLIWSLFTTLRTDTSGDSASLTPLQFAISVLLTLLVVVLFSIGTLQAISRSFGPV